MITFLLFFLSIGFASDSTKQYAKIHQTTRNIWKITPRYTHFVRDHVKPCLRYIDNRPEHNLQICIWFSAEHEFRNKRTKGNAVPFQPNLYFKKTSKVKHAVLRLRNSGIWVPNPQEKPIELEIKEPQAYEKLQQLIEQEWQIKADYQNFVSRFIEKCKAYVAINQSDSVELCAWFMGERTFINVQKPEEAKPFQAKNYFSSKEAVIKASAKLKQHGIKITTGLNDEDKKRFKEVIEAHEQAEQKKKQAIEQQKQKEVEEQKAKETQKQKEIEEQKAKENKATQNTSKENDADKSSSAEKAEDGAFKKVKESIGCTTISGSLLGVWFMGFLAVLRRRKESFSKEK